jgi:lipopolysaccharide export system permease protein
MILGGKLSRYFGLRFLTAVVSVFAGAFALVAMVDFVEMLRRTQDFADVSTLAVAKISLFRVPFVTERVLPFSVLVATMLCYLNLSRRMELVVARAAGISAWQFIAPALVIAFLLGVLSTTVYNPLSAYLRERSTQLEADLSPQGGFHTSTANFWVRQRSDEGQAIINAKVSRQQGVELGGVSIFRFDLNGVFRDRIEAKAAVLEPGFWRLDEARIYANGVLPADHPTYRIKTILTRAQVGESFATPETVPFWQLTNYIETAENAGLTAAAYRLQYLQLLAQPFYLTAMVLLAAAVSLRFFRMGGVQKVVLSGVAAGFALYVLAKLSGDVSKAGLVPPLVAAALPATLGGIGGFLALLYQEDG